MEQFVVIVTAIRCCSVASFVYNAVLVDCIALAHVRIISVIYEGRSINKLQNGAIPLIPKIGKIRNMRFVGNLILNVEKRNFFDDDVIIVTSSGQRTVYLCIIYSTSFLS